MKVLYTIKLIVFLRDSQCSRSISSSPFSKSWQKESRDRKKKPQTGSWSLSAWES